MLLIIFISQKFCVVKSVHVNLSYIVPQIYINMHEIWVNVGMLKKYYNICMWYIIYNQYSIITDIFRSLYLFYPFCPLNPYLTSKTRVGRVFAKKPGFLPSLFNWTKTDMLSIRRSWMTCRQPGVDLYSCSEQILIHLKPSEHVVYTRHHNSVFLFPTLIRIKKLSSLIQQNIWQILQSIIFHQHSNILLFEQSQC